MAHFQIIVMVLSILSLNCNGLRDQSKRHGLMRWLRSLPLSVDVVCLQESHCLSTSGYSLWFQSSGFLSAISPGSLRSCGVIILFCPILSLLNSWSDSAGRFLHCECSSLGKAFRVCSIYCPNRNPARDLFIDDLHPKIDPLVPIVLAGDFDTVPDLFYACCVTDIWRYLDPSSTCFTWTRWNGRLASRIDLMGIPYLWVSSVESW